MTTLVEKTDSAYSTIRSILDTFDQKGPEYQQWMTREEFIALEKLYWECHLLVESTKHHVDPNSQEFTS